MDHKELTEALIVLYNLMYAHYNLEYLIWINEFII